MNRLHFIDLLHENCLVETIDIGGARMLGTFQEHLSHCGLERLPRWLKFVVQVWYYACKIGTTKY